MPKQHSERRAGIDALKLDALRDKHARLHASYKAAAERARDLAKDASLLVMEAGFEADVDLASAILSRDADALAAYSTRWRTRFQADGGQCSTAMADTVPR